MRIGFPRIFIVLSSALLIASSVWITDTCAQNEAMVEEIGSFPRKLEELSGLAVSRKNPNIIWALNDSGSSERVYAINVEPGNPAKEVANYLLVGKGTSKTDWEDMAIAPGPDGRDWIYIADIGNNQHNRNNRNSRALRILRFPEPEVSPYQSPIRKTAQKYKIKGSDIEVLFSAYPNRLNYNAEAMTVDPKTGDIFILTKSGGKSAKRTFLFRFPKQEAESYWFRSDDIPRGKYIKMNPTLLGVLPPQSAKVTSMSTSFDASTVAVLTYKDVCLYKIEAGSLTASTFKKPHNCAAFREAQAEGVALAPGNLVYVGSERTRRVRCYSWPR